MGGEGNFQSVWVAVSLNTHVISANVLPKEGRVGNGTCSVIISHPVPLSHEESSLGGPTGIISDEEWLCAACEAVKGKEMNYFLSSGRAIEDHLFARIFAH